MRVGAHAHYLARDIHGFATLPDGRREELIWIKNWDFKWQGDYGYVSPVPLPKGSKVTMQITYDNTTNNVRNPNHPPKRVRFGMQSTDEMGELYFQLLPASAQDYVALAQDYSRYFFGVTMDFYRNRIRLNPDDAEAHKRFGRGLGYQGRTQEGIAELKEALRLNPRDAEIQYDLGSIYIRLGNTPEAYRAFRAVVEADPGDGEAQGSLGITAAQMGKLDESKKSFEAALRINPEDPLARSYLERVNAAISQGGAK
jgi:tetratricopeptide (TPR) repeat protein